jgi:diguanylate cyclase (GGDEF)-like protein
VVLTVEVPATATATAEARPRLGSRLRVWLFILALACAAALIDVLVVADLHDVPLVGGAWWFVLVVGFVVADLVVVHVNIGRHAHTFTSSDIPLAAALLLMPHASLLTARVVAGVIGLGLIRRQPLTKLSFNLAQWSLGVVGAVALRSAISTGDFTTQRAALVALTCVLLTEVVSSLATSAVIALDGGKMSAPVVTRSVATVLLSGLANTALVLVAVTVIHVDWRFLWAVCVVAGFVAIAHRSHLRLVRRHDALERLNATSRRLGRDLHADAIAREIVIGAASTLNAATAQLDLLARDESPPVCVHYDGSTVATLPSAPLDESAGTPRRRGRGRGITAPVRAKGTLLGHLTVTGSTSVSTFGVDEQHVLNTLAEHASTALTNGWLADELREQLSDNEHQATHDALTGLPNRLMFERVVSAMLGNGRELTVLLLDLDRFKEVNDTLGHAAGDALLKDAGERLKVAVPRALCVARLGGDEFTILLTGADEAVATSAAQAARDALLHPLEVASVAVSVDASIGVALAPAHGSSCDDLLRHADVAMYAAKEGRGGVAVYARDIDHNDASRLGLVVELRDAVQLDQLFLHFQTKVALLDGVDEGKVSVEALVRWNHPVRGLLPPDEFIGVAEQTGVIVALTDWVLATSLSQCRKWLDSRLDMSVAVNLSPRVLRDPTFPDRLGRLLEAHRVPAARLTLEITETAIMDDIAHAIEALWQLRQIGVRLSIDDLGVGHSSLAYLKQLPVHEVKIDKSFVLNIADDQDDDAIVCAVVGLAHRLRLSVVAEGVETVLARDRLVEIGCDVAQGYWYSRPLAAQDVMPWFAGREDLKKPGPKAQLRVAQL